MHDSPSGAKPGIGSRHGSLRDSIRAGGRRHAQHGTRYRYTGCASESLHAGDVLDAAKNATIVTGGGRGASHRSRLRLFLRVGAVALTSANGRLYGVFGILLKQWRSRGGGANGRICSLGRDRLRKNSPTHTAKRR